MERERADRLLVARGFFESRSAARAAIEAGGVTAGGAVVAKPSQMLDTGAEITAEAAHPYVSRAGLKLAHALDLWGEICVENAICLDIGASTGGFTQVLLERGAAHVIAVDVGTGQLHPKVAGDPRVTNLEQTDARALTPQEVGAPDILVCDASFIALEKLLGPVLSMVGVGKRCDLALLFKPQFQVGKANVGRGGIVREGQAVAEAEARFDDWLAGQGCTLHAWADSPILGGDGNAERLVWASREA
jgi:23S rRNA (cytidine1920-2'-O)/16S rRNA (cytidine1409-2'-O)-methyltransferase